MTYNVFKVSYYWYEGEEEHTFLTKDITNEEFEKDLKECRDKIDLEKEVSCLPNWYKQLISFMEEKNYLSLEIPYETDLGIQYILEDEEDYKCLPMIGEDYKHLPRISKNITSIKNEVLK